MTTNLVLTKSLLDEIGRLNPLQVDFIHRTALTLAPEEQERLETYLRYCLDCGLTIEYAARSYDTVVKDVLREQVYFKRHGHYRHGTYNEVAGSVYHDPKYMDRYMHGVALTQFLWPNHLEMFRFFVRTVPREMGGRYLEVGPGHGLFMITAMRMCTFREYLGVDISATSIALTRSVLEHPLYGPFHNYRLEHCDFLASDLEGPFQAIVMGEVLEHVEDAAGFLARTRDLLAPNGYFYMSTAVNGAVIDHIYLFRSVGEVADLVGRAGFRITDEVVIPHVGKTLEECEEERLPVSVAYALT